MQGGEVVRVVRGPPRPRDCYSGLVGRLDVSIVAVSHINVSSTQFSLKVGEEGIRRMVEKVLGKPRRQVIEEIARILEADYTPFIHVGGRPTIPGSSVKGNVRSRIELSMKPRRGLIRSCFIKTSHKVREPPEGSHGWRHWRIWKGSIEAERGVPCDYVKQRGQGVCLVCDLFGTSGLAGLIEFGEFIGEKVELENLALDYGIKLVAAKPGSSFSGSITFKNLKPEELGLLLIGMRILEGPEGNFVLMGRLKYRKTVGTYKFGRIRYVMKSMTLSSISESIKAGSKTLQEPGTTAASQDLRPIIRGLVQHALSTYSEELNLVNEVSAIESL